ncbi:FAD-dependent oxidoreductase OS=Streptomyces tendae OX=1932 GN=GUR47_31720 PE=4 SV=1 [Streptomyces tendae]
MTQNVQVNGSYWLQTAPGGAPRPALAEDLDVDVAVIGAGVAGLSTAWELARTGRSVAVLEAGRVATGVTGYTSAKLTVQHTLVYDRLRRTRGPEGARLYARSQSEAIERAAGIAAELGIDCDWETRDAYTYVRDPGRVDEPYGRRRPQRRRRGLPAAFVTETAARRSRWRGAAEGDRARPSSIR